MSYSGARFIQPPGANGSFRRLSSGQQMMPQQQFGALHQPSPGMGPLHSSRGGVPPMAPSRAHSHTGPPPIDTAQVTMSTPNWGPQQWPGTPSHGAMTPQHGAMRSPRSMGGGGIGGMVDRSLSPPPLVPKRSMALSEAVGIYSSNQGQPGLYSSNQGNGGWVSQRGDNQQSAFSIITTSSQNGWQEAGNTVQTPKNVGIGIVPRVSSTVPDNYSPSKYSSHGGGAYYGQQTTQQRMITPRAQMTQQMVMPIQGSAGPQMSPRSPAVQRYDPRPMTFDGSAPPMQPPSDFQTQGRMQSSVSYMSQERAPSGLVDQGRMLSGQSHVSLNGYIEDYSQGNGAMPREEINYAPVPPKELPPPPTQVGRASTKKKQSFVRKILGKVLCGGSMANEVEEHHNNASLNSTVSNGGHNDSMIRHQQPGPASPSPANILIQQPQQQQQQQQQIQQLQLQQQQQQIQQQLIQQQPPSPVLIPLKKKLCALDFDLTITCKQVFVWNNTDEIDLNDVLGPHRVTMIASLFQRLITAGVTIVIVTFNLKWVVEAVLRRLGVLNFVTQIYDRAEVHQAGGKPALMGMLNNIYGVTPEDSILVDDDRNNLIGAPCRTIFVQGEAGMQPSHIGNLLSQMEVEFDQSTLTQPFGSWC